MLVMAKHCLMVQLLRSQAAMYLPTQVNTVVPESVVAMVLIKLKLISAVATLKLMVPNQMKTIFVEVQL